MLQMNDIYLKRRTMTVAFQRMFGILKRWNDNQVTPSLRKPHELSYRSNRSCQKMCVLKIVNLIKL